MRPVRSGRATELIIDCQLPTVTAVASAFGIFYATHATLLRYVRYVRYTLRYTLRYTSCTFIRRRPPLITLRTSFLFCKRYRQCMYQKTTLRMLYTLRDHRD